MPAGSTMRRSEINPKRPPRSISSLRLASIVRLLALRSRGLSAADLDAEAERCLRGALPSLLEPSPSAKEPLDRVVSWLDLHAPGLLQARGRAWLVKLIEDPTSRRHMKADVLGRLLALTSDERAALKAWTIGSVEETKRQRKASRKEKNRLRMRAKRMDAGVKPRELSLSSSKPWEAEGISRAQWYRRRKASIETHETEVCAVEGTEGSRSGTAVATVSLDANRSEGSLQAIPLAPRAFVIPAEFGPIRRRSLEALARRSAVRGEVAA